MTGADPHDLERFVRAQGEDAVFERAVEELTRGRKTSHWMWFVFPQIAGFGHSAASKYYAISSLDEARAYLTHPILGPRLTRCAQILAANTDPAAQLLGEVDSMKLRSSMTLFLRASPREAIFQQVLDRHFAGRADPATDALVETRA